MIPSIPTGIGNLFLEKKKKMYIRYQYALFRVEGGGGKVDHYENILVHLNKNSLNLTFNKYGRFYQ